MKLNPYLCFAGKAEEALNFYVKALGGQVQMVSRYGDGPMPCEPMDKDKIMHARFEFDGNMVMLSDTTKPEDVQPSSQINLSVDVPSKEKLDEVFGKMSEGATITMAPSETFWGAYFGMLQDKFGVSWMFNCELKK